MAGDRRDLAIQTDGQASTISKRTGQTAADSDIKTSTQTDRQTDRQTDIQKRQDRDRDGTRDSRLLRRRCDIENGRPRWTGQDRQTDRQTKATTWHTHTHTFFFSLGLG